MKSKRLAALWACRSLLINTTRCQNRGAWGTRREMCPLNGFGFRTVRRWCSCIHQADGLLSHVCVCGCVLHVCDIKMGMVVCLHYKCVCMCTSECLCCLACVCPYLTCTFYDCVSVCVCLCVCVPAQASYGDRPVPHLVLRLGADVLLGRSWLRCLREWGSALQLWPWSQRAQPLLLQPVQTHNTPGRTQLNSPPPTSTHLKDSSSICWLCNKLAHSVESVQPATRGRSRCFSFTFGSCLSSIFLIYNCRYMYLSKVLLTDVQPGYTNLWWSSVV